MLFHTNFNRVSFVLFSFIFILFFLAAGLLSLFPVIVSVSLSVCLCIRLLARFIFLPLVSEAWYALDTHETGLCIGRAVGISTRWRFRYSGRSFKLLSCGNVKNAAGTINLHHQIMTPVKAVLTRPIETNSCARFVVLTNFQWQSEDWNGRLIYIAIFMLSFSQWKYLRVVIFTSIKKTCHGFHWPMSISRK